MKLERVSVGWEADHDEGYGIINAILKFDEDVTYEFIEALRHEIPERSKYSKHMEPNWDVTGVSPDKNKVMVEMNCLNTEVQYFEEYFEGCDFYDIVKSVIEGFKG